MTNETMNGGSAYLPLEQYRDMVLDLERKERRIRELDSKLDKVKAELKDANILHENTMNHLKEVSEKLESEMEACKAESRNAVHWYTEAQKYRNILQDHNLLPKEG